MDVDPLARLRAELAADPENPEVHYRLAACLYERGEYEEAAAGAQRALRLGLGSAEARLLLGNAWMRQGCPMEAAFQFRQLLDRTPDHAEAAASYESIRRTVAAIEAVREVNPRELQLDVRNHVIVLVLEGMMAPYTDDRDLRQSFDRLTLAVARLLQLGQIGCVVDLTRVYFVTSFFLNRLIEWRRKLLVGGRGMAICGARPEIRELITSSRVSRIITLVDSLDDAICVVRETAEEQTDGQPG
jgi:tetratricopeptide (TPR) repeat protein